jgi:hypothetical protein
MDAKLADDDLIPGLRIDSDRSLSRQTRERASGRQRESILSLSCHPDSVTRAHGRDQCGVLDNLAVGECQKKAGMTRHRGNKVLSSKGGPWRPYQKTACRRTAGLRGSARPGRSNASVDCHIRNSPVFNSHYRVGHGSDLAVRLATTQTGKLPHSATSGDVKFFSSTLWQTASGLTHPLLPNWLESA